MSVQSHDPANTQFLILSFEGPDIYSTAGGLGVRVTELAETLAVHGFPTHLFFIGDPDLPPEERHFEGRLVHHRWCQGLSANHRAGVYDGEEEKLLDWNRSLPPVLIDQYIAPHAARGGMTVVLAEEWQTADTVLRLQEALQARGLDRQTLILWNANNVFSFHRIDWARLSKAAVITTVSRYMKQRMRPEGVNAWVIHNGIPSRLLEPVPADQVQTLRGLWDGDPLLVKVGRYDPDKRWIMAVEAVADLKALGRRPHLVVRGGMEPHRGEVIQAAGNRGLRIHELTVSPATFPRVAEALQALRECDLIELRFFVPEAILRALYAAADGVLANSGHEPFGLVGLEVMATGGVAYTGSTGEEYAEPFYNSVVIESDDHREIAAAYMELARNPEEALRLRANARATAAKYTWDAILRQFLPRIEFAALLRDIPWQAPRLSQSHTRS